jgi:transposase-like protein
MKIRPIRATDGTNQVLGTERLLLSADQLAIVRKAWRNGETQGEIARRLGVSVDTIRARLRDQLADLPKRGRGAGATRTGEDPTEEEIYGRLVLLEQAAWTDEDRDRRWQGGRFKRSVDET